jgi:hypothetical protein
MTGHHSQFNRETGSIEGVIRWFASPSRVVYYMLSLIIRAILIPLIRLALGIMIKRLMGLTKERKSWNSSQTALLRRYINSKILSENTIHDVFKFLGVHYEAVSVSLCICIFSWI